MGWTQLPFLKLGILLGCPLLCPCGSLRCAQAPTAQQRRHEARCSEQPASGWLSPFSGASLEGTEGAGAYCQVASRGGEGFVAAEQRADSCSLWTSRKVGKLCICWMQALKAFLTKERLGQFTADRNDPNKPGALSGLSPYLHYGQLGAQRMALEASQLRSKFKVRPSLWTSNSSHEADTFSALPCKTCPCVHQHCIISGWLVAIITDTQAIHGRLGH